MRIVDSSVAIIGGENSTEDMVIPNMLDGYPVIGIVPAAFYKNSTIFPIVLNISTNAPLTAVAI